MPEIPKKLEVLLKLLDEVPSKEEFVKSFEALVGLITRVQQSLIKKIDDGLSSAIDSLKNDYSSVMNKLRKDHVSAMSEMKRETDNKIKEVNRKLSEIRDGEDGKDADEEKIIGEVLKKIPKPKEETPQEVRNKLESLKGEDRLDKENIRGLEDEINALRVAISSIPRGRGMGRAKIQITRRVSLTDQVDGNTRSFTLPPDTVDVLMLQGSQLPATADSADWTLRGNTLTLADSVATPVAGQTLTALLDVLFYP